MFTNPQKNIQNFEIMPGYQVADLGAGSGSYTYDAAKLAGENGRVYAIDIQKELLSTIKREAEKRHLSNIEIIWGDIEKPGGTRLKDSSVDIAVISNVLFQIENKEDFVSEIKRILKPQKGKACIIDWLDSFGGLGPAPEMVVGPKQCQNIFENAGFKLHRNLTDIGGHHYGIIFINSS